MKKEIEEKEKGNRKNTDKHREKKIKKNQKIEKDRKRVK